MKFKSETIQSIYDFLEQDADVSEFKRDLIAVAYDMKVKPQDLEAELFQYHDLMKEDLTDKVTFVFREDGYLGMFSDVYKHVKASDYKILKTGDRVSAFLHTRDGKLLVNGIIWVDNNYHSLYMVQNDLVCRNSASNGWEKYGEYNWIIAGIRNDGSINIRDDHSDLKINNSEELKSNMHFALVNLIYTLHEI